MLTVKTGKATQKTTGTRGVQFLSPDHVRNAPLVFKVTKVTTDAPDNFGNPYVVYFSQNGERYSKGYKPTSSGLAELIGVMGTDDETKWVNKLVSIGNVSSEETGDRLTYSAVKAGK